MLTASERDRLRTLALEAVRSRLSGAPEPSGPPAEGLLAEPGSAFVTLTKRGRLRGCVGMIGDRFPLADAVRRSAVSVLTDPRFPPVEEEELPQIDLSISVLGPFVRTEDPEGLEVGTHGVYVRDGTRSALLLPKVAAERGWGPERLLEECCRKAGLGADRWREPETEVSLFTAEEF